MSIEELAAVLRSGSEPEYVTCEDETLPLIRGWGWYFRDAHCCSATFWPYLQHLILRYQHRHSCLGLNDALPCCLRLFTLHANNALVTQQEVLVLLSPVLLWLLWLFLLAGATNPARALSQPYLEIQHLRLSPNLCLQL